MDLKAIEAGAKLKQVETADRSAPVIENVETRSNNRGALLGELKMDHELKHVDTNDKSAPVIDKETKVGKSPHADLMAEIEKKK
mmetsp:Transcript_27205/g.45302  ORF Transcript_27205/g.45302 Transcript_27205/m.45302 type:complete len:84 (-) Transcript_27205:210-461(-)|eukprot:CAMPEP_0119312404 /NCGR_PEP_ID=MMETSP1333-20130426/26318_1 /TAXON_ID=418940 /ORGANISM="Scyphosphaera apsteinii, Strain RCC1455" /LENGTH=83 /DNA_ID=CAMNT_0007317017 /DNA_START=104 /DNA_END=355 /DNA_ORIENTATION=+